MSIAIPKDKDYNSSRDLNGLKIATSYPVILKKYLEQNNIKAEIHTISGSVEITPGINLADAIFDIVSTGSTLISNGLREVEKVMDSEAVLIANPDLDETKRSILDKLLFRIKSVNAAADNKYILLNAPNDAIDKISEILPGMKSPTIMPLAMEGWSSIHTVINEDQFWDKIESLKAAGAQGILVFPIENMIL
jgi:ATP phosphoribosyltransferase